MYPYYNRSFVTIEYAYIGPNCWDIGLNNVFLSNSNLVIYLIYSTVVLVSVSTVPRITWAFNKLASIAVAEIPLCNLKGLIFPVLLSLCLL